MHLIWMYKEQMMKHNKRNNWALVGMLTVMLAVFPFSRSEAQSAEMPLSELGCNKLNVLQLGNMNAKQKSYAHQCDTEEAASAWERSYGGLVSEDLIAGVVYE